MRKIKTVHFFLLVLALSSCRQTDEDVRQSKDTNSKSVESEMRFNDSINVIKDSSEINSLMIDEEPKFPPRK